MRERTQLLQWVWCAGYLLTALLSAWFLAHATFFLLAKPHLPAPEPLSAKTTPETRVRQSASSHAAILERNLFGVASASGSPKQAEARAGTATAAPTASNTDDLDLLPTSTRGWKLLGTIVSADPATSRAVIVTGSGQKNYGEGDSIEDSQIELIRRKTVIVRKGGQRERLIMDTPLDRKQTRTPEPVVVAEKNPPTAKQDLDPMSLMRDISLKPRALGDVQGMEITTLRAGSPLHDLGLRTGDLVLSVNALPIRSFDDLAKLRTVLSAESVSVTLLRNGSELVLE